MACDGRKEREIARLGGLSLCRLARYSGTGESDRQGQHSSDVAAMEIFACSGCRISNRRSAGWIGISRAEGQGA